MKAERGEGCLLNLDNKFTKGYEKENVQKILIRSSYDHNNEHAETHKEAEEQ